MPLLMQEEDILYVGIADKIITYQKTEGQWKIHKLPQVILPQNLSKGQEDVLKNENREINSLSCTKSNQYVAVSAHNKQVVIYSKEMRVVKNFTLNRAASKVRFTPNNDILVADKTGDAYLYELNEDKDGELKLGHLSMLLDILVTNCGKYIVTCDRDEKIRVSHYPNAYNISSYCLGHDEFVTNIEVCGEVLISASGDGTIRFWDYTSGKQKFVINTNEYLKDKGVVEAFKTKMDLDKVEIKALPITDMQVTQVDNKLLIAVSLFTCNFLQIFEVENCTNFRHIQNIAINEVISFSLSTTLYILTSNQLLLYKFKDNNYVLVNDDNLNEFYKQNVNIFKTCNVENDVSVLYKRKFDNVQEYLERKKLRLETK